MVQTQSPQRFSSWCALSIQSAVSLGEALVSPSITWLSKGASFKKNELYRCRIENRVWIRTLSAHPEKKQASYFWSLFWGSKKNERKLSQKHTRKGKRLRPIENLKMDFGIEVSTLTRNSFFFVRILNPTLRQCFLPKSDLTFRVARQHYVSMYKRRHRSPVCSSAARTTGRLWVQTQPTHLAVVKRYQTFSLIALSAYEMQWVCGTRWCPLWLHDAKGRFLEKKKKKCLNKCSMGRTKNSTQPSAFVFPFLLNLSPYEEALTSIAVVFPIQLLKFLSFCSLSLSLSAS